jgi:hypothetical protein
MGMDVIKALERWEKRYAGREVATKRVLLEALRDSQKC